MALRLTPDCPTCGTPMDYQSGIGHDTYPTDARPSYYQCSDRKCDQRDLEVYPPYEPMRTRWGREC